MASKDITNNMEPVVALDFQTISSNTTTNGNIIDLQGFEGCVFYPTTGTVTDGDYAVLIEEGDADDLSDAAAVDDEDLLGTEADASFSENTDDDSVTKIGYVGNKRYVRLSYVSTNTTSGAVIGALAVKGEPEVSPTSDAKL